VVLEGLIAGVFAGAEIGIAVDGDPVLWVIQGVLLGL
jgi:hypothetical protein